MLIFFVMGFSLLILLILILFFFASKLSNFDILSTASFECGFSSYFFSRFSFSLHYYYIGLIFLFLDLELCYLLPFFNEDFSSMIEFSFLFILIFVLLVGLAEEWNQGMVEWKY